MPHRHNKIPLVSCNEAASGSGCCYRNRCGFLSRESILLQKFKNVQFRHGNHSIRYRAKKKGLFILGLYE